MRRSRDWNPRPDRTTRRAADTSDSPRSARLHLAEVGAPRLTAVVHRSFAGRFPRRRCGRIGSLRRLAKVAASRRSHVSSIPGRGARCGLVRARGRRSEHCASGRRAQPLPSHSAAVSGRAASKRPRLVRNAPSGLGARETCRRRNGVHPRVYHVPVGLVPRDGRAVHRRRPRHDRGVLRRHLQPQPAAARHTRLHDGCPWQRSELDGGGRPLTEPHHARRRPAPRPSGAHEPAEECRTADPQRCPGPDDGHSDDDAHPTVRCSTRRRCRSIRRPARRATRISMCG